MSRKSNAKKPPIKSSPKEPPAKKPPIKASAKKPSAKKPPAKKSAGGSNKERIAKAIASRVAFGEEKPSREMIIKLAEITSAKSFANTIADLKLRDKYVDYDKDSIWLTDLGKEYVGPEALATPSSNDEMLDKLKATLKTGKARKIFDLMKDGAWWTRPEIAAELDDDHTKKSFQNSIGSLSKLVDKKDGKSRLKDMCFPCGRPK